jgi:hypothetical protein
MLLVRGLGSESGAHIITIPVPEEGCYPAFGYDDRLLCLQVFHHDDQDWSATERGPASWSPSRRNEFEAILGHGLGDAADHSWVVLETRWKNEVYSIKLSDDEPSPALVRVVSFDDFSREGEPFWWVAEPARAATWGSSYGGLGGHPVEALASLATAPQLRSSIKDRVDFVAESRSLQSVFCNPGGRVVPDWWLRELLSSSRFHESPGAVVELEHQDLDGYTIRTKYALLTSIRDGVCGCRFLNVLQIRPHEKEPIDVSDHSHGGGAVSGSWVLLRDRAWYRSPPSERSKEPEYKLVDHRSGALL